MAITTAQRYCAIAFDAKVVKTYHSSEIVLRFLTKMILNRIVYECRVRLARRFLAGLATEDLTVQEEDLDRSLMLLAGK